MHDAEQTRKYLLTNSTSACDSNRSFHRKLESAALLLHQCHSKTRIGKGISNISTYKHYGYPLAEGGGWGRNRYSGLFQYSDVRGGGVRRGMRTPVADFGLFVPGKA